MFLGPRHKAALLRYVLAACVLLIGSGWCRSLPATELLAELSKLARERLVQHLDQKQPFVVTAKDCVIRWGVSDPRETLDLSIQELNLAEDQLTLQATCTGRFWLRAEHQTESGEPTAELKLRIGVGLRAVATLLEEENSLVVEFKLLDLQLKTLEITGVPGASPAVPILQSSQLKSLFEKSKPELLRRANAAIPRQRLN